MQVLRSGAGEESGLDFEEEDEDMMDVEESQADGEVNTAGNPGFSHH